MKFVLNFTEIQKGFAEIESDSREEAEEQALALYEDGKVCWTYNTVSEVVLKETS